MSTLEQRIQIIEDRQALQHLLSSYLVALDNLSDIEHTLSFFTQDAVFDMSAMAYTSCRGIEALREFFTGVFFNLTHSAHFATNFKIKSLGQNRASAQSHAIDMGQPAEGERVMLYVQYHLEFKRVDSGWKIQSFRGQPLMPIE